MKHLVRVLLWLSIAIGLFGALSLSFGTIKGTDSCPPLGFTRACYVVAGAYLFMALSQFVRQGTGVMYLFGVGWLIAFGLAAYGSVSEAFIGDVCPAGSPGFPLYATPMCYISLGLCLVIAGTFGILHYSSNISRARFVDE